MPRFDLPLDRLREYRPDRDEPDDFDAFWSRTLNEADTFDLAVHTEPVVGPLTGVRVHDIRFAGWGGDPIHGWLLAPATDEPVGCVIQYIGYHGGRGFPHDHLLWPVAGWATLVVDTRGQGASAIKSHGITGDPHGTDDSQAPGMMTKGIASPDAYYYRRVITDAVRAVDVAAGHDAIDADRLVVSGHSQGGGLAQAVAALRPRVRAVLIREPFLTHYRRAAEISATGPYLELVTYLAAQRDQEERVFRTLSYFDGVNFAARARQPALFSVSLMDTTCPPSTVFAAYNHWAGPKEVSVWPWNGHEGGGGWHTEHEIAHLRDLIG